MHSNNKLYAIASMAQTITRPQLYKQWLQLQLQLQSGMIMQSFLTDADFVEIPPIYHHMRTTLQKDRKQSRLRIQGKEGKRK